MIKATKIGNTIVCFIKEKMYQKNFDSDEEIINVYELMMNTDESNQEELNKLITLMSPILTKKEEALETEYEEKKKDAEKNAQLITFMEEIRTNGHYAFTVENDQLFMNDIPMPIPEFLGRKFADPNLEKEEIFSLSNFWRLLALNPNTKCREDLYDFLSINKMTITPSGCFIAYRNVDVKKEGNKKLTEFISKQWAQVKKWKKSTKNYGVYVTDKTKYSIMKIDESFESSTGSDFKKVLVTVTPGRLAEVDSYGQLDSAQDPHFGEVYVGNLEDLYSNLSNQNNENTTIYTDGWSGKMTITIGEPVSIPRNQCDSNPNATCSRGLHAANSEWLGQAYFGSTGLAILINPMNVVACPYRDSGKLRCCEYMPVTIIDFDKEGKVIPFDSLSLDVDYGKQTQIQLQNMLDNASFKYNKEQKIIPMDIDLESYKEILFNYNRSLDVMTGIINNRITDV
jgi:hypothetical protein